MQTSNSLKWKPNLPYVHQEGFTCMETFKCLWDYLKLQSACPPQLETSPWPSGKHSRLWITGSWVWIPLEARFFPNLNCASLHRAFHVHPSIVSKWLKYCWKGCKTLTHPSIHHNYSAPYQHTWAGTCDHTQLWPFVVTKLISEARSWKSNRCSCW